MKREDTEKTHLTTTDVTVINERQLHFFELSGGSVGTFAGSLYSEDLGPNHPGGAYI